MQLFPKPIASRRDRSSPGSIPPSSGRRRVCADNLGGSRSQTCHVLHPCKAEPRCILTSASARMGFAWFGPEKSPSINYDVGTGEKEERRTTEFQFRRVWAHGLHLTPKHDRGQRRQRLLRKLRLTWLSQEITQLGKEVSQRLDVYKVLQVVFSLTQISCFLF